MELSMILEDDHFPNPTELMELQAVHGGDELFPDFDRSSSESGKGEEELVEQPACQRKLPKRKPARLLLWQFLLLQLLQGHSSLAWIEDQWSSPGVFKFTDTNEAARQWGKHKGNRNMSYEKMSRCIRDYFTRPANKYFRVMLPDARGKAHRRVHFAYNLQNPDVLKFIWSHRPDYYWGLVRKEVVKHHA